MQNLSQTICENASCAPGPVIVTGEPDSVPAAAHPASCLQLSSLAVCKMLGAHSCIQAFRRQCACFLNERAGRARRWERKTAREYLQAMLAWRSTQKAGVTACHVRETIPIAWLICIQTIQYPCWLTKRTRGKKIYQYIEGRVCPSIEFEFISTIILNPGTEYLGPNQTNNSYGT